MRRILLLVFLALVAAAVALPLVRSAEHEDLDAAARSRAPGEFAYLSQGPVHYVVEGPERGQPVVFVHGFSIPLYTWDRVAPVVAAHGYRALRFDLYGRGYSARPDAPNDLQLFVDQLHELLEALEIGSPVDLVGLSMGGAIVAAYAAEHADRVRRVVLLAPFDRPVDVGIVRLPLVGEYLSSAFLVPAQPEFALADFVEPDRFPRWSERFREQMRYRGFGRAILSTLRLLLATDPIANYERLGRQDVRVLLFWGDQDGLAPFARAGRVRAALGDAEFAPIAGAGHGLQYEHAGQFNERLLEFLSAP